ncbi:hypothetical protein THAOC_10385 [Thalassiosira oceanica]|uniref:CS domain-containing protein n=1 Tax=Thalassiosira oceanica TaxID=159749 RepID=K0T4X6_THAOC|nr:hypothetical protein THAOC_10385 [Thalassiosira oceanica]|eukprot:EJK68431.1 hypothetical protein THAOC_10385 [Thalassiosira oceanica]
MKYAFLKSSPRSSFINEIKCPFILLRELPQSEYNAPLLRGASPAIAMPLVPQYTWCETENEVHVSIPLKGVSSKHVDVFTAPTILKVSFAQYLLDINLRGRIEEERSRARSKNGTLTIRLAKAGDDRSLWRKLSCEGTKDEIERRRSASLRERYDQVQKRMGQVGTNRVDEERSLFQKHMELEEQERQRIDSIKEAEKRRAEEDLHRRFAVNQKQQCPPPSPDQPDDNAARQANDAKSRHDRAPPVRPSATITFRNTPRLFKTPSRESTVVQENQFILKNRANLNSNALLNGSDIGDADPAWLAKKGDEFCHACDFGSAINAYSAALSIDSSPKPHVLASRAKCFLSLREGSDCIEDCLKALSCASIDGSLKKTIEVRLALAYCLNEEYDEARFYFCRHSDGDKKVSGCLAYLDKIVKVSDHKAKGDAYLQQGDFVEASGHYDHALKIDPSHVKTLMNRASCRLAASQASQCIDDCTQAIGLLSANSDSGETSLLEQVLLPLASIRRRWSVMLLIRRAKAKEEANPQSALKDLYDARDLANWLNDPSIDVNSIEKSINELEIPDNLPTLNTDQEVVYPIKAGDGTSFAQAKFQHSNSPT